RDDFSSRVYVHFSDRDAAVIGRLEQLGWINLPVLFGRDINFSINETDLNFLNARLAPEVLFHPVGSKVSSHAFNAHIDVCDLWLGQGRRKRESNQNEQA